MACVTAHRARRAMMPHHQGRVLCLALLAIAVSGLGASQPRVAAVGPAGDGSAIAPRSLSHSGTQGTRPGAHPVLNHITEAYQASAGLHYRSYGRVTALLQPLKRSWKQDNTHTAAAADDAGDGKLPAPARRLMAQRQVQLAMHAAAAHRSSPGGGMLGAVVAMPLLAFVMLMVTGGAWVLGGKPGARGGGHPPREALVGLLDTDMRRQSTAHSSEMFDAEIDMDALSPDSDSKDAHMSGVHEFAADAYEDAPPIAATRPLLAGSHGWVLSGSFCSPVVGHVGDQQIKFGKLLGCGCVGRVFSATWAGRNVAVKVMAHDSSASTSSLEQQMQQLVSLSHPNIARTFMAVTYTRQGSSTAVGITPSAAAAVAGAAAAAQRKQQLQQLQQQHAGTFDSAAPDTHMGRRDSSSSSTSRDQQLIALTGTPPPSPLSQLPSPTSPHDYCAAGDAEMWVVQEACDLDTLANVALEWQVAGEGDPQMYARLTLLVDAAQGLKELHSKHMLHGDLNARNVLVCSSSVTPAGMSAKLSDMGLAAGIKAATAARAPPTVRGLSHLAPELQRKAGPATPACDIYAFGVMMWEVYTAQPAYRKLLDAAHLYEAIVLQNLRPKIPPGMPADYQLLMERCWSSDPADRPTLDKIIGCLKVMAAERQRRLYPHLELPPPATAAAAAAVAAAAAREHMLFRTASLPSSMSCDPATLMRLAAEAVHEQQQPQPQHQPLASPPARSRLAPALPGGLLQHKSCPAATFHALLRSGAVLSDCAASETSSTGSMEDVEDAAEGHGLLLSRTSSLPRSGPGSAPVMPRAPSQQRFSDGMDMAPDMDDTHTWVV